MTRTFLYDFKKTFTSKAIIISIALLIISSSILAFDFATSVTPSTQISPNTVVLGWFNDNGTYHFLDLELNQFGQPVSDLAIQLNLTISPSALLLSNEGQQQASQSPNQFPVFQSQTATTNSNGQATFTIDIPGNDTSVVNANYTVSAVVKEPDGYVSTYGGSQEFAYSKSVFLANGSLATVTAQAGQVVDLIGGTITPAYSLTNSSNRNILVTWAGPNGTTPKNYSLYYAFINGTQICSGSLSSQSCTTRGGTAPELKAYQYNETNMHFLSNLSSSSYYSLIAPPKLPSNLGNGSSIALDIFSPNGTATTNEVNYFDLQSYYPAPPSKESLSEADQTVLNFFVGVYAIFIPLIAIVGSYSAYGRDRVTGVLESVLAQPISRARLSISRFLSVFFAMVIGIGLSMVVVELLTLYFTGSIANSALILSSFGGFVVELGAFIGIMMFLSRITKSSGILLGFGIGMFLLIDFFWGLFLDLVVNIAGISYGSISYYSLNIIGEFLNPSQFVALVVSYVTHELIPLGISGYILQGFPISPSQFGITILSLGIVGILWIAIPLSAFLYLSTKYD